MNREQALAKIASFSNDNEYDDLEIAYLPPSILDRIAADEVTPSVKVGAGLPLADGVEAYWEGYLVRNEDGGFRAFISHEISPKYWIGAINARYYLSLIAKCVESKLDVIKGLVLNDFDDSYDVIVWLKYSFPVEGAHLGDIFDNAFAIQDDLKLPAGLVVDEVTRALAHATDRILRGHYARPSELVVRVDAAKSTAEKGRALELLMEALFAQVEGFVVYERNHRTETEELDLIVVNGSTDPLFARDGSIILVECKNWTGRPGRPAFSILEGKIRNRHNRCTIAYFISWSGFAATVAAEDLRSSRENYVIVCLAGSEIRAAALAGNFPDFLREKTLRALNT